MDRQTPHLVHPSGESLILVRQDWGAALIELLGLQIPSGLDLKLP